MIRDRRALSSSLLRLDGRAPYFRDDPQLHPARGQRQFAGLHALIRRRGLSVVVRRACRVLAAIPVALLLACDEDPPQAELAREDSAIPFDSAAIDASVDETMIGPADSGADDSEVTSIGADGASLDTRVADTLRADGVSVDIAVSDAYRADVVDTSPPFTSGWDPQFVTGKGLNRPSFGVAVQGTKVWVGGTFDKAGPIVAAKIAAFDKTTNSWSLPAGMSFGGAAESQGVNEIKLGGASGSDLFVGTTFGAGALRWSGSSWVTLAGGVKDPGFVWALAPLGADMYVGGNYVTADNSGVYFARWSGSSNTWLAYNPGPSYFVWAIAHDGGTTYVGGDFQYVDSAPTQYVYGIAALDRATSTWSSLGTGITGGSKPFVSAIVVDGDYVYAGGDFTTAGSVASRGIARFKKSTKTWESMSGGVQGIVHGMALGGGKLWVVGLFNKAGSVACDDVARFDTATASWSTIGEGFSGGSFPTQVMNVAVDGSDAWFVGDFTVAGGQTSQYIARYRDP